MRLDLVLEIAPPGEGPELGEVSWTQVRITSTSRTTPFREIPVVTYHQVSSLTP